MEIPEDDSAKKALMEVDDRWERLIEEPFLGGFFDTIPRIGKFWSKRERKAWLKMAERVLDVCYPTDKDAVGQMRAALLEISEENRKRYEAESQARQELEAANEAAGALRAELEATNLQLEESRKANDAVSQLQGELKAVKADAEGNENIISEVFPAACTECEESVDILDVIAASAGEEPDIRVWCKAHSYDEGVEQYGEGVGRKVADIMKKRIAELEKYDVRTILDFKCEECGIQLPKEPEQIRELATWCREHAPRPDEEEEPPSVPSDPATPEISGAPADDGHPKVGRRLRGPSYCPECQATVTTKKHRAHLRTGKVPERNLL